MPSIDLSQGSIALALPCGLSRLSPVLYHGAEATRVIYTGQEKSVLKTTNVISSAPTKQLHEEIRRARKELGLSQGRLAELCGLQRRQLSVLERGGNVTLNTLRKVIGFLPNLEQFTFEQVRMKPTYIDHPPFEWTLFYLHVFHATRRFLGA